MRNIFYARAAAIPRLLLVLASGLTMEAATPARLVNVSVRSTAGSGSETLIVGFVIGGVGTKNVLLRGNGPSLVPLGVPNAVVDPELVLFSRQTEIARNNDWGGTEVLSNTFQTLGAYPLPRTSKDAALLKSLSPGAYTAHLVTSASPAVALVECYDADGPDSAASLVNISARSMAGTGSNVLTVGFVITGDGAKTVLIRGIGPTLASQGVTNTLTRIQLRLFDSNGTQLAHGFEWSAAVTPTQVFDYVGAFPLPILSADSAVLLGLPAGAYTAQVSGLDNAVGTALVEVYAVENSPVPFVPMTPITAAAPAAPSDPGAGTLSPGPDVQPAATSRVPPRYPFELRRANVTGSVLVEFFVKSDGTVANAVAVKATDVRFATACVEAIKNWIFEPGRVNGRLVSTRMQQPITFSIEE